MGQAKHTAGPWVYKPNRRGRGGVVDDARGLRRVATVHVGQKPADEVPANGLLLASAPALLASCKELRDALAGAMRVIAVNELAEAFCAEMERVGVKGNIGGRADAAIKAAEGE